MKRVAVKFVPNLLNFEQKQRRMEVAQELLNEINDDAVLLTHVITQVTKLWFMDMTSMLVVPVEVFLLAKNEKGSTSAVKREGYAYCVLRF
ncbi:unnamed protein product [Euphydryas editha]|nr:unnamed protein product [Euphydryas editha]